MQEKNNNDNRLGGETRLRDIVDRGNKPNSRKNSGGLDGLTQKLTEWSARVVSFFTNLANNLKKGGKAQEAKTAVERRTQNVRQTDERNTVTVGGTGEEIYPHTVSSDGMLSSQRAQIADWLKTTKFRFKLFAGVDEADVWKKIRQLNRMYDDALLAERARYEALLAHYRETLGAAEYSDDYSDEYDDADDILEYSEYEDDDETGGEEEYEYFDEDEYSDD